MRARSSASLCAVSEDWLELSEGIGISSLEAVT
jgi:hypothetical protein